MFVARWLSVKLGEGLQVSNIERIAVKLRATKSPNRVRKYLITALEIKVKELNELLEDGGVSITQVFSGLNVSSGDK